MPFAVVDLSVADSVRQLGQCYHPGSAYNVALYSHYALLAASYGGLIVMDVQNPDTIHQAGSYETESDIFGVAVQGDYAYTAGDSGLYVFNMAEPTSPTLVSCLTQMGNERNVALRGTLAYMVGDGFHIVNIANPASPVIVGSCALPGLGYDVALYGNLAYVADDTCGLRVIDISNPESPCEIGHYNTRGYSYGVAARQDTVYLADGNYFGVYRYCGLPALSLTTPNGGEQAWTNRPFTITWTSIGAGSAVNILLNHNYPDTVWEPLFTHVANTGHIAWTVTGSHSHQCRIRIESVTDSSLADTSDGNFIVNRGEIALAPHLLAFGGVPVDSLRTQHFWIRNTGLDTLQIDSAASDVPAFKFLNDWVPFLPLGDSAQVDVTFMPRDTLHYNAHVTVYSSGGESALQCLGYGMLPNALTLHGNLPAEYRLFPAYPNPFNVRATIAYDLPKSGTVSLRVYDMLGRTAVVLTDGFVAAGSHRVTIDGTNLASGVYFARLSAGTYIQTTKLVLLK